MNLRAFKRTSTHLDLSLAVQNITCDLVSDALPFKTWLIGVTIEGWITNKQS